MAWNLDWQLWMTKITLLSCIVSTFWWVVWFLSEPFNLRPKFVSPTKIPRHFAFGSLSVTCFLQLSIAYCLFCSLTHLCVFSDSLSVTCFIQLSIVYCLFCSFTHLCVYSDWHLSITHCWVKYILWPTIIIPRIVYTRIADLKLVPKRGSRTKAARWQKPPVDKSRPWGDSIITYY